MFAQYNQLQLEVTHHQLFVQRHAEVVQLVRLETPQRQAVFANEVEAERVLVQNRQSQRLRAEVALRDAVIHDVLVPHRVQRSVDGLRSLLARLRGARKQVHLDVGVGETVRVHRLQVLKQRSWVRKLPCMNTVLAEYTYVRVKSDSVTSRVFTINFITTATEKRRRGNFLRKFLVSREKQRTTDALIELAMKLTI